jgi:hypothetical protein
VTAEELGRIMAGMGRDPETACKHRATPIFRNIASNTPLPAFPARSRRLPGTAGADRPDSERQ